MSDEEKKHGTMGQNEYESGQHVQETHMVLNTPLHFDKPVTLTGKPGDVLSVNENGRMLFWDSNGKPYKPGDVVNIPTTEAIGGTYTVHENGKQIGGPIPAHLPPPHMPTAQSGKPLAYVPLMDLHVESSHVTLSELIRMMDNFDKMKAEYNEKYGKPVQPASPAAPESDGKRKFKFDRDT